MRYTIVQQQCTVSLSEPIIKLSCTALTPVTHKTTVTDSVTVIVSILNHQAITALLTALVPRRVTYYIG